MGKWEIAKRSFAAKKYPKGSAMRKKLNKSALTSEYGSDKYIVFKNGRRHDSYKTLALAQKAVQINKKYNK